MATRGATGRTWVRRPTERRSDLLDAAERLFAKRGLAGTTIADITAAAGVSKGSFYGYFASREELVEALNARLGDELFDVLDEVLSALIDTATTAIVDGGPAVIGPDRLRELLDLAVERMIHALLARRDLIEVWSREPSLIGGSAEWLSRFVDRLAPWVTSGGRGVIDCADPTLAALLVVHGIFGTVLQAIVRQQDIEIEVQALVVSSQELAGRAFGLA